jgi:hypothetical protein
MFQMFLVCRIQGDRGMMSESDLVKKAKEILARTGAVPATAPRRQANTADEVTIESAATHARPIYWERQSTGEILGPATPEFLAMVGTGPKAQYWVVAEFQGLSVWINSVVLRSKRQFDQQIKPRVVERIQEPR